MPTTLREYFGDLYEPCDTKDVLVGDVVIYKDWLDNELMPVGTQDGYVISQNDVVGERIYGRALHSTYTGNWSYTAFSRTGWLRKVTEQPYDPTQMGDKEDDI